MMNTHEISTDDLALYAMRSLESADASRISGHLGSCSSCRTELQRIRTDLAAVALTAPEVAPPARVRERLFADIGEETIHELGNSRKPVEAAPPRWWAATYTGALMLAIAAGTFSTHGIAAGLAQGADTTSPGTGIFGKRVARAGDAELTLHHARADEGWTS